MRRRVVGVRRPTHARSPFDSAVETACSGGAGGQGQRGRSAAGRRGGEKSAGGWEDAGGRETPAPHLRAGKAAGAHLLLAVVGGGRGCRLGPAGRCGSARAAAAGSLLARRRSRPEPAWGSAAVGVRRDRTRHAGGPAGAGRSVPLNCTPNAPPKREGRAPGGAQPTTRSPHHAANLSFAVASRGRAVGCGQGPGGGKSCSGVPAEVLPRCPEVAPRWGGPRGRFRGLLALV